MKKTSELDGGIYRGRSISTMQCFPHFGIITGLEMQIMKNFTNITDLVCLL